MRSGLRQIFTINNHYRGTFWIEIQRFYIQLRVSRAYNTMQIRRIYCLKRRQIVEIFPEKILLLTFWAVNHFPFHILGHTLFVRVNTQIYFVCYSVLSVAVWLPMLLRFHLHVFDCLPLFKWHLPWASCHIFRMIIKINI